ncbi:MAG: type VI secretion system tip protein VgrG, partial [Burkholderiaceae bacterium]|nr:type VI secretion system tip protein VgrG [Burkholderiaceae bacterium]
EFPRRAQIIQHNESTAAFIRRLLKRRGISWYFRAGSPAVGPEEDRSRPYAAPCHTMVLLHYADLLRYAPARDVRFHRDGATEEHDSITAWGAIRSLRSGCASRFSWDYRNPSYPGFLNASTSTVVDQGKAGNNYAAWLEHYLVEAPHIGDSPDDFRSLSLLHQARQDLESKCFYAEGGLRDIGPGEYFNLDGHPELDHHEESERRFLVIAQHILARNNLPKSLDMRVERLFSISRWNVDASDQSFSTPGCTSGELRFHTRLTCIRHGIRFVPAYDPRLDLPHPQMQSAVVAGPVGEEVSCDELGRVKVQFTGMLARDDSTVTAWVRVASSWAGNIGSQGHNLGMLNLPRVGTEVLLAFLGGDPDKPIIIAQLYNAEALPPCMGATGLPDNRYLSGLKSREISGRRANQLRFDDTSGQISAQLASEHGATELNLGWLTQPRGKGAAAPRGEGAELSSDAHLALRGGKGILLSAWQRLSRSGKQLDRTDYLALMEECLELFRSLGEHAAQNQALPLDVQSQEDLKSAFKRWENGSNTSPKGDGGGAPVIGISAPAGISFATSKAIVSYAATNIDTVAQQHLQLTCGQRFNVNAGKGVSLFSHHDGIKAIAHFGKLLVQSQHDDADINAAKTLRLTATEGRLIAMAPTIELVCEDGSFIRLGDGITLGSSKPLKFNAPRFVFNAPETMEAQFPIFEEGQAGERFVTRYRGGTFADGESEAEDDAAPNQQLDLTFDDGSQLQAVTDDDGQADEVLRDAMQLVNLTVSSKGA